jgi:hypothetical protein
MYGVQFFATLLIGSHSSRPLCRSLPFQGDSRESILVGGTQGVLKGCVHLGID